MSWNFSILGGRESRQFVKQFLEAWSWSSIISSGIKSSGRHAPHWEAQIPLTYSVQLSAWKRNRIREMRRKSNTFWCPIVSRDINRWSSSRCSRSHGYNSSAASPTGYKARELNLRQLAKKILSVLQGSIFPMAGTNSCLASAIKEVQKRSSVFKVGSTIWSLLLASWGSNPKPNNLHSVLYPSRGLLYHRDACFCFPRPD